MSDSNEHTEVMEKLEKIERQVQAYGRAVDKMVSYNQVQARAINRMRSRLHDFGVTDREIQDLLVDV